MIDAATTYSNESMIGDLALGSDGQLASDESLETAILHSLFTDARAGDDDPLPWPDDGRRGWWGSLAMGTGENYGSKLWLLRREKLSPPVQARAREYAQEALAWLVRDGHAKAVRVIAEKLRRDTLGLNVEIQTLGGGTFSASYQMQTGG